MKTEVLKNYINEILRVTVQRIDPSDEKKVSKTYTKDFDVHDDDADELDWFLDNYARPVINYKIKKETDKITGDKKKVRVYDGKSEDQISSLMNRLATIASQSGKSLDTRKLMNVMLPWGEEGYKAISLIATHTERTAVPFPFFQMKKSATIGSSIDFSRLPVSKRVLDYAYNVTPRIGKNDTGKGEFIIALLTGGIAGTEGLHGDLEIDGKDWEVKGPSDSGAIRLGDLPSSVFREKFSELYKNNKDIAPKISERSKVPFKSPESTLAACATRSGYNDLRGPEGKNFPEIFGKNGVLNKAVRLTLKESGIEGLALVYPEGVRFVSTDDFEFYNSGGKSGRLHIILRDSV